MFFRQLVAGLDQVFELEPQAGRQVLRHLLAGTALMVEIGPKGISKGAADLGTAAD